MEVEKNNPKDLLVSIGERLKVGRDKKGLAIDQVQKQTHIHSTVLRALEEGRGDEILTPTYVRSFLKKYSLFLGLDSKEILKEYSSIHPQAPSVNISALDNQGAKGSHTVSKFIYSISIVLLLIAFLSLLIFLGKKAAPAFKKQKPVKVRYAPSRRPAVEKKVPEPIPIPKKSPFKLAIKVKKTVRVGIKKDGVLIFERVLPKGTEELLTANDKIEMNIAKAEAVELILNGRSLGSPGKGVIKNLEITSSGIKAK